MDKGVWRGNKPGDHMQEKQSCHNSTKPEHSKTILADCSELLMHSQMAAPAIARAGKNQCNTTQAHVLSV